MLTLVKLAETSTTITLGWTPPAGVECYGFFANGSKVSTADDRNKDGSPRDSVRFSKTNPGPPFAVVALLKVPSGFSVEWGAYSQAQPVVVYPGPTRYPAEVV